MKTIAIYWNNDSGELDNLPNVTVLTCGNDGMEVVGSDAAINALYECVKNNPDKFTLAQSPRRANDRDLDNVLDFHGRGASASPYFDNIQEVKRYLNVR